MTNCYICGKTRNIINNSGNITFHKFPSNSNIRKKWYSFVCENNLPTNEITKYSVICSSHFDKKHLITYKRARLIEQNAVPYIMISRQKYNQDPCNKLTNFANEDELSTSFKTQLLDRSHSSENVNNDDKLNLSCTKVDNNFETLTLLTSTDYISDKNLLVTNIVHDSSDLNKTECNVLIDAITNKKDKTDMSSQEEKQLEEILIKNKNHIFPNNIDTEINTQQFIDLNFNLACQKLKELSSPLKKLDSSTSETQTINQIDSDNSIITSPLPLINELGNAEIKNGNTIITVNDSEETENVDDSSSKIDLELSIQDQYIGISNEDQHTEIISFRTMCEELLKVGATGKNKIDDDEITVKKNNQIDNFVINNRECEPSKSKLSPAKNSNFLKDANCSFKRSAHKKKLSNSTLFQDEEDDCILIENAVAKVKNEKNYSKCLNINDDSLEQKKLSIENQGFDYYSQTGNVHQGILNNLKKRKLWDSTLFQDEEDDCMLIEIPLSKVKNSKCLNINNDSLEQKKLLIENQGFNYYSSTGKVHQDMLNYIKQKDCHWF